MENSPGDYQSRKRAESAPPSTEVTVQSFNDLHNTVADKRRPGLLRPRTSYWRKWLRFWFGRPVKRPGEQNALLGWLACLIFVAISLPVAWYCHGERSAWARINVPGDESSNGFTLLGYNFLVGPTPLMQENAPFVNHVVFMSGVRNSEKSLKDDPYVLRVYYGLFATPLAPFLGVLGSMLVVNWLAWAACAWVAWRLCKKLFADELAALFAVVFVAGGMGPISHVSDYSAHLLSFIFYYLGIYLIYQSGILFGCKPWRTHLVLGAYLAVACLTYPGSVMLIAVYILAAFRRNAYRYIAGAVLLAMTARPLWKTALGFMGAKTPDLEAGILMETFAKWAELFRQPWPDVLESLAIWVSSLGLFDSPLVVVLGLFSCFYLPRRSLLRWFGAVVLGFPLLLSLVSCYGNFMSGYQFYGISIWLYCWLGRLLARGLRGGPLLKLAAGGCLCLSVGSHFAWSTAYLWQGLGPLKIYIVGWPCGLPYFVYPQPQVVSMTGTEKTPILFGGDASLSEAGARVGERERTLEPGAMVFGAAFVRQLLPLAYLGLFAASWTRSVRRYLLIGGAVPAVAFLSAGLSWTTLRTLPLINHCDQMLLEPQAKMSFQAALSPAFLDKLTTMVEEGDILSVFVPVAEWRPNSYWEIYVTAGSTQVIVDEWVEQIQKARDTSSAIQALTEARALSLEMVNYTGHPLRLVGWQRHGLQGRAFALTSPEGSPIEPPSVLPAVEIRLMRPDFSLKLAGF